MAENLSPIPKDAVTDNPQWTDLGNNRFELSVPRDARRPAFLDQFVENRDIADINLPVWHALPKIQEELDKSGLVVLKANTGSGKTMSSLALALLEPDCPIHISQETRFAVRSNAQSLQDLNPSGTVEVGYKLSKEENNVTEKTQVRLWTGGSLINEIRNLGRLPEGKIVIDEADVRSTEGDLLLYLVKHYLPKSPKSQVIVLSATMPEKISTYLKGVSNTRLEPEMQATTLVIDSETYSVTNKSVELQPGEHHTEGAIRAIKNEIIDKLLLGTLSVNSSDTSKEEIHIDSGSIAVMVPGKEDVNRVFEEIRKYLRDCNNTPELIRRLINPKLEIDSEAIVKEKIEKDALKMDKQTRRAFKEEVKRLLLDSPDYQELAEKITANLQSLEFEFIPVYSGAKKNNFEPDPNKKLVKLYCGTTLRRAITIPDCFAVVDSWQKKVPITDRGITNLEKVPVTQFDVI